MLALKGIAVQLNQVSRAGGGCSIGGLVQDAQEQSEMVDGLTRDIDTSTAVMQQAGPDMKQLSRTLQHGGMQPAAATQDASG